MERLRKNAEVLGNEKSAFQIDLVDHIDPLPLQQFGLECMLGHPNLGLYGDIYEVFPALVLVKTFPSGFLDLSPPIASTLSGVLARNIESFVMIHTCAKEGPCQHFLCSSTHEVSCLYHPCIFEYSTLLEHLCQSDQPVPEDASELVCTVEVGLWNPEHVIPAHAQVHKEVERGVPFGALGPRRQIMHGYALSPNNLQVELTPGRPYHAFDLVAHLPSRDNPRGPLQRWVISHHLIPSTQAQDQAIREVANRSLQLEELIGLMQTDPRLVEMLPALDKIAALIA
ncbi:hypothetical protein PAPYR_2568 [Paratrimastix pyriformis]|uniref:Uncharacterized protein n=1 Tax=Paratrimastix pyriformis TaxID=342808 RepID=A0ABQ8UWH2_9EUKA|nr:hypothetical protein PAPYR_2568 [Paratrimastix pyriformis]